MSTDTQVIEEESYLPRSKKTFLGHPVGLFVLFFTEMWERFSYYGMRGLLKLYMVNYLFVALRQVYQGSAGITKPGDPNQILGWNFIQSILPAGLTPAGSASVIYGWYTGLVYLTPVIGGIFADKYLGQRKTVVLGALLMAAGQFLMTWDNAFFLALAFLIVGNGAFKPNISTQVGNLYAKNDPRRDGAFTIFYMGINLGAFICNLVCGTLAAVYGWHYGFGAAGVGMLIGLVVYLGGQRFLGADIKAQKKAVQAASTTVEKKEKLSGTEWKALLALAVVGLMTVVFWAAYEQQGNTMQTWADEKTVWPVIFGFRIPSTWYQSVNPFFIFVFAPVLDMFWAWKARRNPKTSSSAASSVTKMAIGCIILGVSFLVMVAGAQIVGAGQGSVLWLVLCTLLITIGELYVSPIGLSLVTKVAPARLVSTMMGIWFLNAFFGNILSGYIGVLYDKWSKTEFFLLLTALGVGAGFILLFMATGLKKVFIANEKKDIQANPVEGKVAEVTSPQ